VLGNEFPGPGTIYMEQTLRFSRPVHIGDTLTIVLTVLEKNDESGVVKLGCEACNQKGQTVISGMATVLAPKTKIERPRPELPEMHLFDAEARMDAWLNQIRLATPLPCAVIHPCKEEALRAAVMATERGLIDPLLLGPEGRIRDLAQQLGLDLQGFKIVPAAHSHAAAEMACTMAEQGKVAVLMQGSLSNNELLQTLQASNRKPSGQRMAQIQRFDIPTHTKPLYIADVGVHIAPDLEAKADILRHAIDLAHAAGLPLPKVAVLSAVESISERIASTMDAAALCKMAQRGQITGALLDGPLAFDNAVNLEAAQIHGMNSAVAGDADVLLVHDLESGSLLGQLLEYMAGAVSCSVLMGAALPIAMSGRSDSAHSRLGSIALAALAAQAMSAAPANRVS